MNPSEMRNFGLIQRIGESMFESYIGISVAFITAVLPASFAILLDELYGSSIHGWANILAEFAILMSIPLIVGLLAVVFLRALYLTKVAIRKYWNRYTPPFNSGDFDSPSIDCPEEAFAKAEKYAFYGLLSGIVFMFGSIAILFLIDLVAPPVNPGNSQLTSSILDTLSKILLLVPIIGEAINFAGNLPGNGLFEKIWINSTAVFFAVGLRNLIHIFENPAYIWEQASTDFTNRYTIYSIYAIASTLTSTAMLGVVIYATQF